MTETQEAIEEAPKVADNDAQEAVETEDQEVEQDAAGENEATQGETEGDDGEVEFPKKAVNALNRKNKQLNKLRAETRQKDMQMRELEAKLNEALKEAEQKQVNPDDFENYGDYMNAQVENLVEQRLQQSQGDMQKKQIQQQQAALQEQRDQYIREQANEVAQTFTDLPQVWEQNAQLLDALPKEVTDIFYSIDNAPAAVYTLAKEGKLEGLLYANPAVAAYEIVNAQNRGLEKLSKPQTSVSQAPTPISKAKGTGSVKKQLSPNDDVLKSLGLKR